MNQFDNKHWKFHRTDPFKHTPFTEDIEKESVQSSLIFVIAVVLVCCFFYLN
jgi:hypothetical protein